MRTLALVFFTTPALAVLLLGCDSSGPLEPAGAPDPRLTAAASGPQLPAPTSATAVSSSESQIDITWRDNSTNETRFEVHRSTTGEYGAFILLATTEPNLVAYRDRGLEPGQYCYRIRAVRVAANRTIYSTFSNTACATAVPAAPSNASAVPASETQIDISWQDNSSYETGFELRRSIDGETGTFGFLVTTGANTTAHSDGSLRPARRYCYQIRAFTTGFSSAWSNTACATSPSPSNPPAALSDVDAKPTDSHTISVSWTDTVTYEEGFRIYRSTDAGAVWNLAGTVSAIPCCSIGSFEDSGRQSEQPAWYRVMAFNAAGEAAPSNIASTTPPAGPTNLTERLVDAQTVELSWNDNSAVEDGYEVWLHWATWSCCPDGGFCDSGIYEYVAPIAEFPANSTTATAPWGESCGFAVYGHFVKATKDGGSSDPSNEI